MNRTAPAWPPRALRDAIALALLALLMLLLAAPAARANAPLELSRATRSVDAWPAVTLLADLDGSLDAQAALAAAARFSTPMRAAGTLGVEQYPTWIRIPLRTAADAGPDWVMQVDFALLDQLDVYLVQAGTVRRLASAGRHQDGAGAFKGRVPAVALKLEPATGYTLLLRVKARGPRLAPISIMHPDAFHHASLSEQMLQGLLFGLAACLIVYSLGQWIALREPLYGKYAMFIGGLTLYSVCWFGLGEQFLWGGNAWFSKHMMGLSSQLASAGAYLFVEHILARPGQGRAFARLMRTLAAFSALVGVAWALDLIDHRVLIVIVGTIGAAPMLFGLPGAIRRMRQGDTIGVYFVLGWASSVTGAVVQTFVIAGKLPANFWTVHALQFGVTFDMLLFIRMISLRSQAIQATALRAEAEARMKSAFLARMSHEIRTPMNAIIGLSRLALMGEAAPRLRDYLSKILGAGEDLLGLVDDILDHSKMQAGKLAIEVVPFTLDALLEHLSGVICVESDAKGVELIYRIGPGVPTRLVGDPLRLGQVLINLAGNAVKFTERGEVVVALAVRESAPDRVLLEFSVTDTGIGIAPHQMAGLFESFEQADGSTTRKYGGTGLGLSISRQLVELMGGQIAASSTPGAGSRFSFTVPLAIDSAARAVDAGPAFLSGLRALVVDDSPTAAAALAEMLAALGMQAQIAATIEEAEGELGRAGARFDLILMDSQLPGLARSGALARIGRQALSPATPLILMTPSCLRETDASQPDRQLAHAFLDKPVSPALLVQSLLQALHPQLARCPAQAGAPTPLAALAELARLDGARILLAEDNANNREVALEFMAAARMQVDVACDGVEAVRMAMAGDYDLVLMDIQMPGLDGLDATRAMRDAAGAHPHLGRVPIVAMTAHALESDRIRSLDAGMNDHVTKPIDPDRLFGTLLRWIDPARLAGRALPTTGAPPGLAAARHASTADLPAVPGLDWRHALENVDGQRQRLEKRAGSFVRAYADAPASLRQALGGGDHARLQWLAHNLKSSAAYVGAFELSAAAHRLERDLRAGQADHLAVQVPGLVNAAETVLGALAQLADATRPHQPNAGSLAPVAAQLQAWLREDDARAEDGLDELETLLGGAGDSAALATLRQAVHQLEYAAALAPLAELVASLGLEVESPA